jgi:hypothetical protein
MGPFRLNDSQTDTPQSSGSSQQDGSVRLAGFRQPPWHFSFVGWTEPVEKPVRDTSGLVGRLPPKLHESVEDRSLSRLFFGKRQPRYPQAPWAVTVI